MNRIPYVILLPVYSTYRIRSSWSGAGVRSNTGGEGAGDTDGEGAGNTGGEADAVIGGERLRAAVAQIGRSKVRRYSVFTRLSRP